ncbi:hypothetical protein PtB15_13B468 [Puccinia triticina]|nr:hypothetical protein PtB15_13B468 [Puccinia triticina]
MVVLRQSTGKVVLYHSTSNRLSVHHAHQQDSELQLAAASSSLSRLAKKNQPPRYCPLCLQSLNIQPSPSSNSSNTQSSTPSAQPANSAALTPSTSTTIRHFPRPALPAHQPITDSQLSTHTVTQQSYFDLLSQSNSPLASRPLSPIELSPARSPSSSVSSDPDHLARPRHPILPDLDPEPLGQDKRVDGYYERFFIEVMKLGRGQKGSVFLCTHTLDGNALGDYAIKKIAVGQSSHELMHVLNEVKFLESLRHPNITQYHHAWIEKAQLSRFGPRVPVLYVLMNYANGGTLAAHIALRKGSNAAGADSRSSDDEDVRRRSRQKARFRQRRTSPKTPILPGLIDSLSAWKATQRLAPQNADKTGGRAVHLFGFDEIFSIFEDTCRGLGFLHSQGILHHDLKTENVLLHWASEDAMIPTALISDFGSSISQSENWSRERTGRTGTLDWVPPESLKKDPKTGKLHEVTQKGDLWQLGLVLHCLCFFRLPYTHSEDIDLLKDEITQYPGFLIHDYPPDHGGTKRKMPAPGQQHSSRSDLPRPLLQLLSDLLCLDPRLRPSCERVLRRLEKLRETLPHDALGPQKPAAAGGAAGDDALGPATGPASALVKRRRIFVDSAEGETPATALSAPDFAARNVLSVGPGPSPSVYGRPQQVGTHAPAPPASSHRQPEDHPPGSPRYLPLPSPSPPRAPHLLPRPSRSQTLVRRGSCCSLPGLTFLDRWPRRWVAGTIALFICLKSVFLVRVLSTKPLPRLAAYYHHQSNTPSPQDRDPPLDHLLVMVLVVLNTLELLLCHPAVSVGLTAAEVRAPLPPRLRVCRFDTLIRFCGPLRPHVVGRVGSVRPGVRGGVRAPLSERCHDAGLPVWESV